MLYNAWGTDNQENEDGEEETPESDTVFWDI